MTRDLVRSASRPQRSLRHQMLLIVMASTAAALLMSACALLSYEVLSNRSTWSNDVRSQSNLISQSVAPALVFGDRKVAAEALQALRLRPQIVLATVFDASGKVFASYEDAAAVDQLPVASAPTEGLQIEFGNVEQTSPITQDGERLGTLYLRARYDLGSRIIDYLWILALASAAGMALAALIFRRLHPAITGPIAEMANVAGRIIANRDYALRVSAASDNEVGVLVTAFNNMLEDLSVQMTERSNAEDALRVADRRKDEFLATLAHELRNPLAPLSAGLELLKRKDEDPASRMRVREMMNRQLKQMVRLIDDLLEVSRITRGKLELRRETVDACTTARLAVEAVDAALKSKSQHLSLEIVQEPVWVHVDAARLTQVIVNLLTNAVRYTPPGGHIRLGVSATDDTATIRVTDDGIGIEPANQQAIFGMFVQVNTSLERGAAGLGIGLTIARELTQMHGGRLSVESAGLGAGASFAVNLPLVDAPASRAGASSETQAIKGLDLLIADDNVDFAETFAQVLRSEGHRVRVADNGRAALMAVRQSRPAVAFLDIGMPEINGLELAAMLRKDASCDAIILVAVTGWGQQSDREKVATAGFQHHLVKPMDLDEALGILSKAQMFSPGNGSST